MAGAGSNFAREDVGSHPRLLCLLAPLLAAAQAGCVSRDYEGWSSALLIRDGNTGQELRDCLLIRWGARSAVGAELLSIAGPASWRSRRETIDIRIRRVHSGVRLSEQAVDRVLAPIGPWFLTRYSSYGYAITKRGYLTQGFGPRVGLQDSGLANQLEIRLARDQPGTMSSDGDVIVHAKWLAERSGLIKHEEEGLYRELLAISGNQLQRVLRAEPRPSRDDEGNWVPYTAAHWEWTTQEARRALARIGELLAEARPATRNGADGPPASAAPGPSRRL